MRLSERKNGLKSRAFGDCGLSGSSFFQPVHLRHRGNSEVGSDNSNGENDNIHRENDNIREKCGNTLWQQPQAKSKCMTTARSPEPTSSVRLAPGVFLFSAVCENDLTFQAFRVIYRQTCRQAFGQKSVKNFVEWFTPRKDRHNPSLGFWRLLTTCFDGLFCGQKLREQVHVFLLEFHRRMHIAIHCDVYACVSKDFAKTFDIETQLNTSGCERVPKCMKIYLADITFSGCCFEAVFHIAWFHVTVYHTRK